MNDINLLSEDDLIKFKDYLEMTKKSLGTSKKKTLAYFKYAMSLTFVGGGVALAILFPNPVTIAVLGGFAVLAGRKNPKKSAKKLKEMAKQKSVVKADLITVENRLKEINTEKAIQRSMYPSIISPYFDENKNGKESI